MTSLNVGDVVQVKLLRSGKEKKLELKVSQRPGAATLAKKEDSKKKNKKQPVLDTGMVLQDLTPEVSKELNLSEKATGVLVVEVKFGSYADKAGFMRGDLIIEVDRKPIPDQDSFEKTVNSKKSYLVRVRRLDPQGREAFSVIVLDLKG